MAVSILLLAGCSGVPVKASDLESVFMPGCKEYSSESQLRPVDMVGASVYCGFASKEIRSRSHRWALRAVETTPRSGLLRTLHAFIGMFLATDDVDGVDLMMRELLFVEPDDRLVLLLRKVRAPEHCFPCVRMTELVASAERIVQRGEHPDGIHGLIALGLYESDRKRAVEEARESIRRNEQSISWKDCGTGDYEVSTGPFFRYFMCRDRSTGSPAKTQQ